MNDELYRLLSEARDLQMEIRACNPERLGLIVLRLIDINVRMLDILAQNLQWKNPSEIAD